MDLIFPKRCLGCGKIGRYFCSDCRKTIRHSENSVQPISFFRYQGIIQKAIKAFKYRYVSDLASELVSLIPEKFFSKLFSLNSHIIVPIPLHASRFRERGYNQAEVLGKLIAQKLNIPVRTDTLKRVKKTTPQVEMKKRSERLQNMQGVFESNPISGDIILFDDVYTTGATMRSAAQALKLSGAQTVWFLTMAR